MSLPYLIRFVKSANNRCNFFQNCGASYRVFFNGVSKWKCVQIFVPCKVALFLQDGSQVFERACFQQPYYDKLFFKLVVQVSVFFNGVSKEKCVQIFVPCKVALFRQECSQVFERVYFLQPYYVKRCCEICYLLPKIGNFTKKIAKKYLKPLTVFGD